MIMAEENELKRSPILIVDCTGKYVDCSLLDRVRKAFPDCDSYVCYKMDYVTSQESKNISLCRFHLMDAGTVASVLEPIKDLHPRIKEYKENLEVGMVRMNQLHKAILIDHNFSVLSTEEGKEYMMKMIAENLYEQNIHFDWTEANKAVLRTIIEITNSIFTV